jgi:hypothetical protein
VKKAACSGTKEKKWTGLLSSRRLLRFRKHLAPNLPIKTSHFLNVHTSVLKMEIAYSFETSISAHKTIPHHSTEDHSLN